MPRLIEFGEERVDGHLVLGDHVGEGPVALPQDRRGRQRGDHLLGGPLGEPHGEQTGERVAVPIPVALVGEIGSEGNSQRGNGVRRCGHLGEVTEVPAGERDDHERDAVAAGELLTVLAEDRVADPLPRRAVDHHLGQEAEVSRRRERDVLQRDADPLAHARGVAVPQRRGDGECGVRPARDVPGGQHVVDRARQSDRAGDQRETDARVDGVVDPGASVRAAGYLDVDEVRAHSHQGVVRMPLASSHIGDQDAAVGDQALDEVLPVLRAHVHGDGTLALVESGPVDAVAVLGHRPAVIVGGAADRVDADDLGTQLRQRHAGQRHRDEAGDLDDPHSGQRTGGIRSISHATHDMGHRRGRRGSPLDDGLGARRVKL